MCFEHCRPCLPVLLAILLPLITCPGCSVRENRDSCPCLLELDFPDMSAVQGVMDDGIVISLAGLSGNAGGFVLGDTLSTAGGRDGLLKWKSAVPRGHILAGAVCGEACVHEPCSPPDAWIKIKSGSGCPKIWTACADVDAAWDCVTVPMVLHKNYTLLTVLVRDASGTPFPFRMEVRGNVCGYAMDGRPVSGMFSAPVEYLEDVQYRSGDDYVEASVSLPRQNDSSLMLDIVSDDDTTRSFAIGNYMEASGYDWTSPDLKDLTMEIDYSRTVVCIRIGTWRVEEQFEVVI